MDINRLYKRRLTFHKRSYSKRLFNNIPPLLTKEEYDNILAFLKEKGKYMYKTNTLHRMMNEVASPVLFAHRLFSQRSGTTALLTGTQQVILSEDYYTPPALNSDKILYADFGAVACHKEKQEFSQLMSDTAKLVKEGSSIAFYYRNYSDCGEKESMVEELFGYNDVRYTYRELEKLLSESGWRIYEHLDNMQADRQFFEKFNIANIRNPIKAQRNICYVLAVKK